MRGNVLWVIDQKFDRILGENDITLTRMIQHEYFHSSLESSDESVVVVVYLKTKRKIGCGHLNQDSSV